MIIKCAEKETNPIALSGMVEALAFFGNWTYFPKLSPFLGSDRNKVFGTVVSFIAGILSQEDVPEEIIRNVRKSLLLIQPANREAPIAKELFEILSTKED